MNEVVTVEIGSAPLKHQFAKLVIGTIIGFVAKELSERAYDAALTQYKIKKAVTKE
jgi:uncharacterized membrane-anchored protein YhcB (DUF1043 family)